MFKAKRECGVLGRHLHPYWMLGPHSNRASQDLPISAILQWFWFCQAVLLPSHVILGKNELAHSHFDQNSKKIVILDFSTKIF